MLQIPSVNDYDTRQASYRGSVSVRITKKPTAARGGFDLVAKCVDPETGRVDTVRIACWLSDAAFRNLDAAACAYAAVEAHLLARSPGDVARLNQDLVDALRSGGAGRERSRTGNPVLLARWLTMSPPEGVAAAGLRALLARHRLEIDPARA